jgi:hypothetical protein
MSQVKTFDAGLEGDDPGPSAFRPVRAAVEDASPDSWLEDGLDDW